MFSLRPSVAKLVARLSSSNAATAKEAAAEIDKLIYPDYGSGPRLVSAAEDQAIREKLYGKIRRPEFIEPLIEALATGSEFAREYACTALGAIRNDRAVPALTGALADPALGVRQAAARSLAFFQGNSDAVPELIRTLNDPSSEVVRAAAHTLGVLGATDAVPALMELFERGDLERRISAIGALGWIADTRSLPLVRSGLLEKNRKLRKAAKSALGVYDLKRRGA